MRTAACTANLAVGVHAGRKEDYTLNFDLFCFLAFVAGYITVKGIIEAFAILRCFDWMREFGFSKNDDDDE